MGGRSLAAMPLPGLLSSESTEVRSALPRDGMGRTRSNGHAPERLPMDA